MNTKVLYLIVLICGIAAGVSGLMIGAQGNYIDAAFILAGSISLVTISTRNLVRLKT